MQHVTHVGVKVGRGEEGNDVSKAPQIHVSVKMGVVANSSL